MSEKNEPQDAGKSTARPKQPDKKDIPEGAEDQPGHQREPGYDEA
jgi:hypothetical protein